MKAPSTCGVGEICDLQQITDNMKWYGFSDCAVSDIEWLYISFTYCSLFVWFLVKLCSSWQDFNWQRIPWSPESAKLLVYLAFFSEVAPPYSKFTFVSLKYNFIIALKVRYELECLESVVKP